MVKVNTLGLPCPDCGSREGEVIETRPRLGPRPAIYRRRRCKDCGAKFSTNEIYGTPTEKRKVTKLTEQLAKAVRAPAKGIWCGYCGEHLPKSEIATCRSNLCPHKKGA